MALLEDGGDQVLKLDVCISGAACKAMTSRAIRKTHGRQGIWDDVEFGNNLGMMETCLLGQGGTGASYAAGGHTGTTRAPSDFIGQSGIKINQGITSLLKTFMSPPVPPLPVNHGLAHLGIPPEAAWI